MISQILCVVIAIVLLVWSTTNTILRENDKKYFHWSVFLIILVSLSEIGCRMYDNTMPENRIWSIVFNLIGFGISPLIFLIESNYYSKNHNYWVYLPAIVNFLMVCFSPFLGWIFYVTPMCDYRRGPLFCFYIISFGFSICISLIRKIKAIKHFPSIFKKRILCSGFIMVGAVLVQVMFPQYHTTWIIICVYFVLHYALICEISSMVDGLTGLLNKTVFTKHMLCVQKKPQSEMYLFMIDVNDFKVINDKKGHLFGDDCLIKIAEVLKESFEKDAFIYRFGGDEFCILLSSGSKKYVEQLIRQLKFNLEEKRKDHENLPNVAIGYEKFSSELNVREIIDLADEHMYENKRKMKICYSRGYINS